jgi:hypothetical protein
VAVAAEDHLVHLREQMAAVVLLLFSMQTLLLMLLLQQVHQHLQIQVVSKSIVLQEAGV